MFEPPKQGQFTQGTIFSCGYAEKYTNKTVYGLVITARCDAAQLKVPIYSFIPVVSLRDWIFRDGADILLRRIIDDAENSLKNILREIDISASILRTTPKNEIIEKLLKPLAIKDRRFEKNLNKFSQASLLISECEKALLEFDQDLICQCLNKSPKTLEKLIKELSSNKTMGHYLLRTLPTLEGDSGDHVALLREVHHIPNTVAQRMIKGISKADWMNESIELSQCPAFISNEDYCMPLGKLRSPWIEHVMQNWAMLFSRIGVEDIDSNSVKESLTGIGLKLEVA